MARRCLQLSVRLGVIAFFVLIIFFWLGQYAFVWMAPSEESQLHTLATAQMNVIAEALEEFKSSHGQYPTGLADLSALFGGELPRDPFSRTSYEYRRQGDGFLLRCLGADNSVGGSGADADIVIRR